MKRLMILGAGPFQLSIIERGVEMGHYVIALSNNASDPGLTSAHEGHVISTMNKQSVLELARDRDINGIATIASEISAVTVAYVAEQMGLPGYPYKSAVAIAFKNRFRALLQERNLPSTPFGTAHDIEESLALYRKLPKPIFLKPSSASGSRGTFLLKCEEDLEMKFPIALAASIMEESVVLESFMQGSEIGGEAIIQDGRVKFCVPTRKYVTPQFVVYGHALPAGLTEEELKSIKKIVQRLVGELKLTSGALNFDIMLCEDGPRIIELGGRLGGNCLPDIMRIHTGIDMIEIVIKLAMGEPVDALPPLESIPVGAYIFGSNERGKLLDYVSFEQFFEDNGLELHRFYQSHNTGDIVQPFTEGGLQAGYFYFTAPTPEKVWAAIDAAHEQEWLKVDSNEME